tara:strand:+ start:4480 stop:4803 length:324 start_codon:yes stop_codon:yes gene_type:complete
MPKDTRWNGSTPQYLSIEKEILGYLDNLITSDWDIETIQNLAHLKYNQYKTTNENSFEFKQTINKLLFMVNNRKTTQSGKQIAQEIYEYKLYKSRNMNENKIKNKTT